MRNVGLVTLLSPRITSRAAAYTPHASAALTISARDGLITGSRSLGQNLTASPGNMVSRSSSGWPSDCMVETSSETPVDYKHESDDA